MLNYFRFGARCLIFAGVFFQISISAEPVKRTHQYAPSPADNPLRGLVRHVNMKNTDKFPHSMVFDYLPLSLVVVGPDTYDWSGFENFLNANAAAGCQSVVRFYLECPGRENGTPEYLIAKGLKVIRYQRELKPIYGQKRPPVNMETPDYKDPELRKMLHLFIENFGKRYDGDSRIGFIQAGLLGHWGEWHDLEHTELFAPKEVQVEVMDAYESAFRKTRVLVRYPIGSWDQLYASNKDRKFGYHDDSFAWSTIGPKKHFFMSKMRSAGAEALDKWKTQPVGGEIRPEAWRIVFDDKISEPSVEDFSKCVEATHASWLLDGGMFGLSSNPKERRERAIEKINKMGYVFHISESSLEIKGTMLWVSVSVENMGVAPFYYEWPIEYGITDSNRKIIRKTVLKKNLTGILPGSKSTVLDDEVSLTGLKKGRYRVLIRVPNPLPKGKPVRFANSRQDEDIDGWLTLDEFDLR
jgi:hypothetical protein